MTPLPHTIVSLPDLTHYLSSFSLPGAFAPFHWSLNIALGLILCFFGARLFSISMVCCSGLLAGLGSYMWLAPRIEQLPALVIAVIAGVLCALVVHSLLKVGFFMLGVVVGGSIAGTFLGNSIWVVAAMLASGIVSMLMYRVFIGIVCAGCGALLLSNELLKLIGPALLTNPYVFPALVALFFIAGLFFQAGFLRNRKDDPEDG